MAGDYAADLPRQAPPVPLGDLGGVAGLIIGLGVVAVPGITSSPMTGPLDATASGVLGAGVGALMGRLAGTLLLRYVPKADTPL